MQAALEKLKRHPEPEIGFMLMGRNTLPAYNMQAAVDAEHSLIVANTVVLDPSDNRCLQPIAEATKDILGIDNFSVHHAIALSAGRLRLSCQAHLEPWPSGRDETPFRRTIRSLLEGAVRTYFCA